MSLEQIPQWIINTGAIGVAVYLGYKLCDKLIDKLDSINVHLDKLTDKITEVCTMLKEK